MFQGQQILAFYWKHDSAETEKERVRKEFTHGIRFLLSRKDSLTRKCDLHYLHLFIIGVFGEISVNFVGAQRKIHTSESQVHTVSVNCYLLMQGISSLSWTIESRHLSDLLS